jgi:hypothetical protein
MNTSFAGFDGEVASVHDITPQALMSAANRIGECTRVKAFVHRLPGSIPMALSR